MVNAVEFTGPSPMPAEFENLLAVVCGGTQGIGRAVAIELATRGATIALIARNAGDLAREASQLPTPGEQRHSFHVADFQEPDQVRQAIETLLATGAHAEILINNTGGPPPGAIQSADPATFERTFRQHLVCNQILAQALIPGMRKKHFGRIVNIISTSVKQPIPGLGVSNTIRGAVASWAKTLAWEVGPDGITVNNVLPGYTRTARLEALLRSKAEESRRSMEELTQEMLIEIPARRFAEPHEIATAVAFLASPRAGYVNGINLPVDGGRTLCL